MIIKSKAFSLVELVVVVTILAVLAAIGFASYSGYLVGARDTNRTTTLSDIRDSLQLYKTENVLPTPSDYVELKSSGSTIAYQGYVGKNILELIKFSNSGKDPKYDTYYSYYVTKNKKYFQLLGFLEKEENLQVNNYTFKANASDIANYSKLFPTVYGDDLGIFTTSNNTPIQEDYTISNSGYLDITTTNTEYIARFDNSAGYLSGTGSSFQYITNVLNSGGVSGNCKTLLKREKYLKGKDGIYMVIDPSSNEVKNVYCDMTTDGGGWTLVLKADGNNTTFDYSSSYWDSNNTLNENTPGYDTTEFKSSLFNNTGFDEVKLELVTSGTGNYIIIDKVANSLLEVFNAGYQNIDNLSRTDFINLVPGSALQLNCNNIGFNFYSNYAKARMGIVSNNESTDCNSNDSNIGIGLSPVSTYNSSVGNNCKYSCVGSEGEINSFGYLYVR